MTMTEKYKILGKYIKDMSSETKDIETYLFVKDQISKYQLGIDINSKALKDKLIERTRAFPYNIENVVLKRWFWWGNRCFVFDDITIMIGL